MSVVPGPLLMKVPKRPIVIAVSSFVTPMLGEAGVNTGASLTNSEAVSQSKLMAVVPPVLPIVSIVAPAHRWLRPRHSS